MAIAVRLRDATTADLPWLAALAHHDDVAPFLSTDAADLLSAAIEAGELLVVEDADARALGAVWIAVVNRRSRVGAIRSLMVDPSARGRGVGAAALRAVTKRLLVSGTLHRLEAEVYGFNGAALRAFERAGYTREGVRRAAYDRHGTWQDSVCLGLVAEDLDLNFHLV